MKRFLYMTIAILTFFSCEPIDNLDSIEVLQERKIVEVATLTVTPTVFEVEAEGGKLTADIKSNCTWSVSSDATWCRLYRTQGTGDYSLAISVDENTTYVGRTATITIECDTKKVSITVTQRGKVDPHRDPNGDDNTPPSW